MRVVQQSACEVFQRTAVLTVDSSCQASALAGQRIEGRPSMPSSGAPLGHPCGAGGEAAASSGRPETLPVFVSRRAAMAWS